MTESIFNTLARQTEANGKRVRAEHTPAPWTVEMSKRYPGKAISVVPVLRHDSLAQMSPFGKDYSVGLANARLIAAAPELLQACKTAFEVLDNCYDVDEPEPGHRKEYPFSGAGTLIQLLSAAIAKVEGRQ